MTDERKRLQSDNCSARRLARICKKRARHYTGTSLLRLTRHHPSSKLLSYFERGKQRPYGDTDAHLAVSIESHKLVDVFALD